MYVNYALILSCVLFVTGLTGVVIRKNILNILMSIELMLNAVNVSFVAFSKINQSLDGQMAVFFIITVAAAETAVGLGLLIALFRNLKEISTEQITLLKN